MAKKVEFPRHVYRKGGPLKWNRGITYSREYVTNETEYNAALKAGYIDDFNEALLGDGNTVKGAFKVVEESKEEETPKVERKGIFGAKKPTVSSEDDF
jgi:hypothetical protein